MRDISDAIHRAFCEIENYIEISYNQNSEINLENIIEELGSNCYLTNFKFIKPHEVILGMEYIDEYIGNKFDHIYDIEVLQTMFIYVVANNFTDVLEKFINKLKNEEE